MRLTGFPLLAIASRELRSLFLSPLAWTVLAVVQAILAWVFLIQLEAFSQWQPQLARMPGAPGLTAIVVAPVFKTAGIVLLLVAPVITMRLLSEEHRNGTLTLLLSAPVSMTEIVLGKFLGVMGFFLFMLASITLLPLSLLLGGTLDFGLLAAGLLGLALMTASFAAAGLFMSTLTTQPPIAAVGTLGLLLGLWMLDWTGGGAGGGIGGIFAYLSITSHLDALLRGVFDTRDIAYYLLFIITFLVLAIRRMDIQRT